ncbi:hypothetical protein [Comamonas sp. MYb69]|uniref:hypothetical protein n=1 Tax=Comamonas sp. MYb69 TaxID=1848650 RepID=UPI00309CE601
MSLDATHSHITKLGRIVISEGGEVTVQGFEGEGCSCRDLAAQACIYGARVLMEQALKVIEQPGRNKVTVD